MQIHNLKRNTPNKKHKSVGRGGKRGKTSGRGTKGQRARSGRKLRPELRDTIKKYPKLRGRGKNLNTSRIIKITAVTLRTIERAFNDGDTISPAILVQRKLISNSVGHLPKVKILATGTLSKKVTILNCSLSTTASKIITDLGGTVK